MTESAGELLFEVGSAQKDGRHILTALAAALGQLYGETIRSTRFFGGLKDVVQMTFMSGMAESPNFGREEEPEYKKLLELPDDQRKKTLLEGSWKDESADENV